MMNPSHDNFSSIQHPLTLTDKQTWRRYLHTVRQGIPPSRRQHASHLLLSDLLPQLQSYRRILSFASKPDEIDLWKLNAHLAREKRLFLPKVVGTTLEVFAVEEIGEQLALSPFSILEPIPTLCTPVPWDKMECILVPGLGFDLKKRRIGYGKGYYDRLLAIVKRKAPHVHTIGLAFHEQKVFSLLPAEPHDIAVDQLLFY